MSVPRCGYCHAPTMTGCICKTHWRELLALLDRCRGLEADLWAVIGKTARFGEQTRTAAAVDPAAPVNFDAADARRRLRSALYEALEGLGATIYPETVDDAARAVKSRQQALSRSWVAPSLLGHLEHLVPAAVAATDRPRSTPGYQGRCLRCGEAAFLRLVGGALRCPSCGETMTIREVQGGA